MTLHQLDGAGEGNRTPVSSLGSWRSTIELHPRGPELRLRFAELRLRFFRGCGFLQGGVIQEWGEGGKSFIARKGRRRNRRKRSCLLCRGNRENPCVFDDEPRGINPSGNGGK